MSIHRSNGIAIAKAYLALQIFFASFQATPALGQIQKAWEARYDNGQAQVSSADTAVKVIVADGFVYTTGIAGSAFKTVKYSTNGSILWVSYYDSPADVSDFAEDIVVDRLGNVYVTGLSVHSHFYSECITIKYAPGGNELWQDRYTLTNAYYAGYALALDTNDNLYVAGAAAPYYLLRKYAPDGTILWTVLRTNHPPYAIEGANICVALDKAGYIYTTGSGSEASRTAKYAPDGRELWVANHWHYGGQSMGLDAAGNVYTVYRGILKYSPNGALLWARTNVPSQYVKVSPSGNVYCAVDGIIPVGVGGEQIWTCKYDSSGNQIWTNIIMYTRSGDYRRNLLAIDNQENVYVTGIGGVIAGPYIVDYNWVTVKYHSTGIGLWRADHNGQGNRWDYRQCHNSRRIRRRLCNREHY